MQLSKTSSTIFPAVYVGNSLSSLAKKTAILCDSANLKIAPHFSTATLSHKYGRVSTAPGAKFVDTPSLDLAGKFVAIKVSGSTIFTGVIVPQQNQPYGTFEYGSTSVPTGNNLYTAYSLDFLLDRIVVDHSHTAEFGVVKSIFDFNGSTGSALQKNRSTDQGDESYLFDYSGDGATWSALDIIEYLLAEFAAETGLTWSLAGEYSYLNNIITTVSTQGKTLRQIINELVSPSFGFTWYTKIDSNKPQIFVIPIVDDAIIDNGQTIVPANPDQTIINSAIEQLRRISNVSIAQVEQSAYDYIRVTSEPVRVMATFKIGDDYTGLTPVWNAALATDYDAALEYQRADEKYDELYASFELAPEWNQLDASGNPVAPIVDESDLSVSFSADNPFCHPAHLFDRQLPVRKDPDNQLSDYRTPLFFVKDVATANYYIVNKLARTATANTASIGLAVSDEGPGITLNPPWQHIIGLDKFTGDSTQTALYSYDDTLFTASLYTDAVLAYQIAGTATAGHDRTKQLYVPGYHYWVGLSGTRTDRDTTLSALTVYRDDRSQIKKLAAMAKAWYGRVRNTVSFSNEQIYFADYLGYVITSIYSGGNFTSVGTVMSAIDYNFIANRISFATDFMDVDFVRISRRSNNLSRKATAARIARLEEKTANLPVRTIAGVADSYNDMFKVINTSTATENKLKIIDGMDPEATDCGIATISDVTRSIPVAEITVTATGAIIMETIYDDAGEQVGASTIKYAAAYTPVADKSIVLLSRFIITNGKITKFTQPQHGPIITTIDGEC